MKQSTEIKILTTIKRIISIFVILIKSMLVILVALYIIFFLYNGYVSDHLVLPISLKNNYHAPIHDIKIKYRESLPVERLVDDLEPGASCLIEIHSIYFIEGFEFIANIDENKSLKWDCGFLDTESATLTIHITIMENGRLDVKYTKLPFTF